MAEDAPGKDMAAGAGPHRRVTMNRSERLTQALESAADGEFPAPDGRYELLKAPAGAAAAVVAFDSHSLIASDAPAAWLREHLPDDDITPPLAPRFLAALGDKLNLEDDGVDVLLAARGLVGSPDLSEISLAEHPRVARALALRADVRVFSDTTDGAILVLGRGLAHRLEVAVEVAPSRRCQGLATRTLIQARQLAGPSQVLFAQTAPANAPSLRAFISAGFKPIGSEVLFFSADRLAADTTGLRPASQGRSAPSA